MRSKISMYLIFSFSDRKVNSRALLTLEVCSELKNSKFLTDILQNLQKLYWCASFTSDQLLNTLKINSMWSMKGSREGRRWGQLPPPPPLPIFWQIRKPYLNRRADYAHHITTPPPDYQAFLRPYLEYEGKLGGEEFGVPQKTT